MRTDEKPGMAEIGTIAHIDPPAKLSWSAIRLAVRDNSTF
jgi:hypothetical protein